jgi:hypothetical protein
MKEIAGKLKALERQLDKERGPFSFFALVRRGEVPDSWDLVISAPWASADMMGSIRLIAGKLKQVLAPHELLSIAAIVPLDQDNPFVEAMQRIIPEIQDPWTEIRSTVFNGITMPDMFILTSTPNLEPTTTGPRAQ